MRGEAKFAICKKLGVSGTMNNFEQFDAGTAPDSAQDKSWSGVELSVVVPTRNERGNVQELITRLDRALVGIAWEAIFVDDDSADGTADLLREVAQTDRRIRVIQRVGRRGLSSACIEGVFSSSAPYFAIMDADLQHEESMLPKMLTAAKDEQLDLVVGSRYIEGGSTGDFSQSRVGISRFATHLAKAVIKTELQDPMSGFLLVRRTSFDEVSRHLSGRGFKILLDILASAPRPLRCKEMPYRFGERFSGESKLDSFVALEYLHMLLEKTVGRFIPIRFLTFSLVGALGVLVHLCILRAGLLAFSFVVAQTVATLVAMIGNFALNNEITYRDSRLRGWKWLTGLGTFILICGAGAVANVGIASVLFVSQGASWWLAGIAGTAIGSVWNYAMASAFTWRTSTSS